MKFRSLVLTALMLSAVNASARADTAQIPDLSGIWARTTFGFEILTVRPAPGHQSGAARQRQRQFRHECRRLQQSAVAA